MLDVEFKKKYVVIFDSYQKHVALRDLLVYRHHVLR